MIIQDILLHFPDPNKPFTLRMDASKYQLGAKILQEGKIVALFSRKLMPAQLHPYNPR